MDFPVWVARTKTPVEMATAIRRLQHGAPDGVKQQFAISEDGGFDIESAFFKLRAG